MNTIHTRKKILYLITKSNWGGAQRYVYDLATHLDPKQFDVTVALGGNGRLAEELARAGIRVHTLRNLERDISLRREWGSVRELWNLIAREQPDILHINSSKAGGLGGFLGRMLGVPQIIFTAHGWAFNEDRPAWQKSIITFLHWLTVLFSHKTIAVSEAIQREMRYPFIAHKMEVIHHGCAPIPFLSRAAAREHFCKLVPALTSYKDDFWSTTIAELHTVKQHNVVIRALKDVVAQFPSVRHVVMGEGEERKNLEALITELQLEEHVFLAGNVLKGAEYLQAFDLFVLGSKSESFGYVIVEAAAAGLPIIASNVGGIPEIITDRTHGLLFNSLDHVELAHYYRELYLNPPLRHTLGKAAYMRSTDFTFERSFAATLKLYQCA